MNVKSIGGKEFLIVNTINENSLNPFYINVEKIRYIREYKEKDKKYQNRWGLVIGEKIFATDEFENLHNINPGETINIGKETFLCVLGNSLSGVSENKMMSKHFLNMNNVIYMRKYFDKKDPDETNDSNKNVSEKGVFSDEIDKFAIITVDNRTLPVGDVFTEMVK